MKTLCVLGDGAWGTAVASLLANNGYHVKLWCHDAANAQAITRTRINERYFPKHLLSEHIRATNSLEDAIQDTQWIFEAIPVQFMRAVILQAKPFVTTDQIWVVLSKGIEKDTGFLPTQIIDDVCGARQKKAVVAGPSFAADLAQKQVTAVSVAAADDILARELQVILENDYFKAFMTSDFIGVQVGGALKNVITLGVGMLDGAGYTDNTKAYLVTRGLSEMALMANNVGGESESIYGLSGVGDLMLTALGTLSRNLAVGKRIGRGDPLQTILKELGHIPEGINTVQSVKQFMLKKNLELPICNAIYEVIFQDKKIDHLVTALVR